MNDISEDSILVVDECRGIYAPQSFVERFGDELTGIEPDTLEALLAGPDHEFYWECWDECIAYARIADKSGKVYSVWQDGDVWLVPIG